MALSELELKQIDQVVGGFCRKRSPPHLKDKLRLEYSIKGQDVVIFERRPRWGNKTGGAENGVRNSFAERWVLRSGIENLRSLLFLHDSMTSSGLMV